MARDTCRGEIETFFTKMARNNQRSVGTRYNKERVPTRICSKTTVFGNQRNKSEKTRSKSYTFRNSRASAKKCNRGSTKSFDKNRFLQYIVFSGKEKRGNETSYQSQTPQQVSTEKTLQNGYNEKGLKLSSKRRLVSKSRFKRCVFPYRNLSTASEIPTVFFQGDSLSVPSSVLRTYRSPPGVYEISSSSGCLSSETEHPVGNVFRRLAVSKQNENAVVTRSKNSTESPLRTRFCDQQEKILSTAYTDSDLHWGSFLSEGGSSLSNFRTYSGFEKSSSKHPKGSIHCERLFNITGQDSIMHRSHSECKTVHETNSASSVAKLESRKNVSYTSCPIYAETKTTPFLVVTGSEHSQGSLFSTGSVKCHSDHRCKQHMGLGRSYEQSYSARPLVSTSKTPAYKLSGDGSGDQVCRAFSPVFSQQNCIDSFRQYDYGSIHQQTRGYEISESLQQSLGPLDDCSSEWDNSESSSCVRQIELSSRCIESSVSKRDRVVPVQISCEENIQSLGYSADGSFCHSREQTDTTVLYMGSSSSVICDGCPINCMAEHVCLCVSASSTYTTCTESHATVRLHSDSDRTELAETTLVPCSTANVGCQTFETANTVKSIIPSQGETVASKSGNSGSDCMAHINQRLKTEGFSEKSCKLLSASWRTGTQKDYRSKFRMFCTWCREQNIDPYTASLKDCVNFLTFKFHKGSAYRTIAGYRSMMSSVLPPVDKFPVGQHPYVIRLLRGVFNERPPAKKLVPEWNLLLVLGTLKEAPFEPLRQASLKHLSWKTCFLIAVTSFRRCSDLKALKLGEGCVNVQKKGVTFVRQNLSKQDRPGHTPTHVFIPSFPNNKKLDPKRCLAIYLKRTEEFRKSSSGTDVTELFLATKSPHKPVSSQTISNWIVNTIKFAYKQNQKSVGNVKGHSTRSVGPSWALFKGVPMKSVMESADWSRESTFIKHYLSSVNIDFLQQ